MVFRTLVLAQAVAILLSFAPGVEGDRWLRLGLNTLFVQWVALLSIFFLCLLSRALPALSSLRLAFLILLILLMNTTLVSYAAFYFLSFSGWALLSPWSLFLQNNLLVALVVGLLGIQFFAMHAERLQRMEAQSSAELDALQARIQPHFLFNCLNSIAETAHDQGEKAEVLLLHLAGLLRAAMQAGQVTSLQQELTLCRSYLALESVRLGERLQVDWQLPAELPELNLPALTLQPLLENAVRHGVEPLSGAQVIQLQGRLEGANWIFLVRNPVAQDKIRAAERPSGAGVALENIRHRLALFFGEAAQLSSDEEAGFYQVRLSLPLQRRAHA